MQDTAAIALNKKKRRRLFGYTLLAMASYQLPAVIVVFAIVFNVITDYNYKAISFPYLLCMLNSISSLFLIWLKRIITRRFIAIILHYQALVCLSAGAYMAYAIGDQRQIAALMSLMVLNFVFIQSKLHVSFFYIVFTVALYLSASYIGIRFFNQQGSMISEILFLGIYLPVCVFMSYIARVMQDQQKKIRSANAKLKSANSELETTYETLEAVHTELEFQNERTMESLRYAEMIQRSLLPGIDRLKEISPDSMFIWVPKDIVGGDIFYTYSSSEGNVIALMDCTGHGVPGAFLTMIVYSEIRKIILDEKIRKPSEILARLNRTVKTALHKNKDKTVSDDGLDAAVCFVDNVNSSVVFAGSRLSLYYVKKDKLYRENGDKHSLGYKDSDENHVFRDHVIDVDTTCDFYLVTDGFTDQLGGKKGLRFGTKRFSDMITANYKRPYSEQRKMFIKTLREYQGDREQIDDTTLIGFRLPVHKKT